MRPRPSGLYDQRLLYPPPPAKAPVVRRPPGSTAEFELFSDGEDFETTVKNQQAIFASLQKSEDDLPAWAGGARSQSSGAGAPLRSVGPEADTGLREFVRKASPPAQGFAVPEGGRRPVLPAPSAEASPEKEDATAPQEFSKKAVPPIITMPFAPLEKLAPRRNPGPRLKSTSMAEREAESRLVYHDMTLAIYDRIKSIGIEMELKDIVEEGVALDVDRFKTLTAPNRAATGLGYARLMVRLLDWREEPGLGRQILRGCEAWSARLHRVPHPAEVRIHDTRTFLYSVDYYAKAFGFSPSWFRAKRLSDSYAKARPSVLERAPGFTKATMCALEAIVLDVFMSRPARVAAGKLRLCIQASIRHDDLSNTPLSACEWARRPGERKIVGLRSRAATGKTGPRPGVGSARSRRTVASSRSG